MKKQVLLIGDSIRMGYCEKVKTQLADKADVIFPADNCRSSQYIIFSLFNWIQPCNPAETAVAIFNCGHWDTARFQYDTKPLTSPEEYRLNLYSIVAQFRKLLPDTKLVFATTTPMNPVPLECSCPRSTEDIMQYNRIASEVMKDCDVPVLDLFETAQQWGAEYYLDYCHYSEEGNRKLAEDVCRCIEEYL